MWYGSSRLTPYAYFYGFLDRRNYIFFIPVLYFSDQDVEPRTKKKRQENNNSID